MERHFVQPIVLQFVFVSYIVFILLPSILVYFYGPESANKDLINWTRYILVS